MGAINKFINGVLGKNSNDDDDTEYIDNDRMGYDDSGYVDSEPDRGYDDPYTNNGSRFISMASGNTNGVKMVITQPTCYEDVQEIGDYLKSRKSVIVNLETVTKEEARRILDFMSGAAFIVEGSIQKVSNLIYLMTPKNIEIQNDVEKTEYNKQKMSFSWMK